MQDKEKPTVYFEKANLSHEFCIFSWLKNPHVQEFWDNSEDHRKDIFIFINGRKEPSTYANGIFDYWIGSIHNHPYCLLMTSEIIPADSSLPEIWKPHLSEKGKTFSLDFTIGDENYIGKGLGAHTLSSFTGFIQTKIDSIDTFIIDPAANNPRAKHVY